MPKISVLIPVYNVEKYIKRCIDSIISQSFKDIEIICVNDASTDNSLEIIKDYQKKDNRIIIIDKKQNEGVMMARKDGYKNASGEYFFFGDSDDYLPSDTLSILFEAAQKNNSDITVGNYIYSTGSKSIYFNRGEKCADTIDQFKKQILDNVTPSLAGNLFKRSLFENIEYETFYNQSYSEDRILLTQILENAKSIKGINKDCYVYCQNNESITRKEPSVKSQKNQIFSWNWSWNFAIERNRNIDETKRFLINKICWSIENGWDKNLIKNEFVKYKDFFNLKSVLANTRFPYNFHYILCLNSSFYCKHQTKMIDFLRKLKTSTKKRP